MRDATARHALVVFAHPDRESLTGHTADRIQRALTEAGCTAEVADLAGERFDPRFTKADLAAQRGGAEVPADVRREQERVERAETLVLVFPVYWWNVPALLKGWIDRVFQYGWAYGDGADGPVRGDVLAARRVHLVGFAEADAGVYERRGYAESMRVGIGDGIFDYCGGAVTSSRIVHWADGDAGAIAEEATASLVATIVGQRA